MSYESSPLIQKMIEFKKSNPISLHVPGHKNGRLSGLPEELRKALAYDFTELTGLDDLHEATGVIKEAEQKLAHLYQSNKSFFLINGSTVGNLAMIYATCGAGDTVIVQRNAHKSVFNAIELTGAKPVFIAPEWDVKRKISGMVTVEIIREVLSNYPEAKAVVLTYPTYYGTTGNGLKEIISICHGNDIPVLVDEAHGAHFVIGHSFPQSALDLGADVVVHSAHKTLPAMTMASFLHIKSNIVSEEKVARYLQMLQSSSPSYLLMASLDDARSYAESFTEEDMNVFLRNRFEFIKRLGEIRSLQVIEADDTLKLILRVDGYSGFQLLSALEVEGVYAELGDLYQVLFVLPLLKTDHLSMIKEVTKKVESSVLGLQRQEKTLKEPMEILEMDSITAPSYTIKELDRFQKDWLSYEGALGRISAASVIPYPPGIPLILAGERITKFHIQSLSKLVDLGAKFQGAIKEKKKQILVVINEVGE